MIIAALLVSSIPTGEASAATDYQFSGDTLVTYTGTAQAVSVPSTVKTVGEGAFAGCSTVESVTVSTGVKKIAYAAFSNMTALKSASCGNSVKSIGNAAFSGDYNLTDFTLGASVEELGTGIFVGCSSLSSIAIDRGNHDFVCVGGAIYNSKMTVLYELLPGYEGNTFTVPDSVTTIKEYAFYGCNSLESVSVGANVTAIPAFCFANCINLQTVSIPYSCTRIEMDAFLGDVNLSYLAIPPSVYMIDDTAFDGCYRLTISAKEGTAGETAAKKLESISEADASEYQDTSDDRKTVDNIPDSDASGNDVSGNNGMGDMVSGNERPEGEAHPGEGNGQGDAPEGNGTTPAPDQNAADSPADESTSSDPTRSPLGNGRVNGSHAVVFVDNTKLRVRDGNDTDYLPATDGTSSEAGHTDAISAAESNDGSTMSNIYELMKEANEKGDVLPKFTVVDGQIVADQAFYHSQEESEPVIPEGINEIGEFAYARSNLTSAMIPEGVTRIDYAAFYHCDQLTEVSFPSTVEYIGPYAFDRTGYLTEWMKTGEEFLIVGDGFLLAYGGGYSGIHIPEGVKHIGPYAFAGHQGITNVTLPESLLTIEEGAFSGCTNLSTVKGASQLVAIKDRAFYNCPLVSYTIPESLKTIGLGAFANDADHESDKTLIFTDPDLPLLSFESSAMRLTNDSYRISPFEGVDMAVLGPEIEEVSGTILEDRAFGFNGILPDREISSNDAQDVSSGQSYHVPTAGVTVSNLSEVLSDKVTYARLEGASDAFVLKVADADAEDDTLQRAYLRTYGESLPYDCVQALFTLYEKNGVVPLTKLGTQNLAISMELPQSLYKGKLHVVTVDSNGQLEELPYTRVNDTLNKSSRITFRTNHFSVFGFYSISDKSYASAVVSDGKAIFSGNFDESPDTGDLIHPKWFLVLGLIFAGIAFLLSGSIAGNKFRQKRG